jgi:putative phosphoribosyl transferase
MSLPFQDRHDAGRQLGDRLHCYAGDDAVVVALPRGGVPVGYEIAHALQAPLEVFMLRHLRAADADRTCFGVVGSGGVRFLFGGMIRELGLTDGVVDEVTHTERLSLVARERTYRGPRDMLDLARRIVIIADDGTTDPAQLQHVVRALSVHEPRAIILAVPVLHQSAAAALRDAVDDLIVIVVAGDDVPQDRWYRELPPVSHPEVRALLLLVEAEAQSRELARV